MATPSVKWGAIDLNLLVVFDAVMQERSVTRAGHRLGLSQPAMSHALTRLRHMMKDDLFIRGPRGMAPTPRAEELAVPIRHALDGLQQSLEPARFDPERYAPPREEDKRDFAFIAFGGGRHKCLGNAFAILQIKAILAMLLGQYEFELAGDEVAPDFHGLVIGPKEPCRVRYRRRKDATVSIAGAAALARTANELEDAAQKMAAGDVAGAAAAAGCPVPHGAPAAKAESNGKCPVDHAAMAAAPPAPPEPAPAAPPKRARKAKKALTIVLDTDLCQGHAVCVGECAEVFYLGPDGKVAAKTLQPGTELNDQVREAARHCPTRAIKLEERT